jgi:glycosyltransferase involved in cell wall biosynthesis
MVSPREIDELAEALSSLVSDPERRASVGAAALASAKERFDVAVLSGRIQDILLSIPRRPWSA